MTQSTPVLSEALRKHLSVAANEKNRELGMKYYSENMDDYDFLGYNNENDHVAFVFRCRRSFSSLTLKIPRKQRTAEI